VTRKLVVSFVGVIAIALLCVFYITNNVLHISLAGSPTVTVEMPASGGLFAQSPVVYRGVTIGRVQRMDLVGDHVEARFSLRTSLKIPASTKALVRSLSPAGEQYLDLRPDSVNGPFLKNGSVIQATSVSLPETVANGLGTIKKVLDQIDTNTLKTTLDELSTGFTGASDDLNVILTSSEKILTTLDNIYPQTQRLLQNSHTILQTGLNEAGNLQTFSTSAKTLATWLKSYDPKVNQFLDQWPGQFAQIDSLVTAVNAQLPNLLSNGLTVADILAARDPHLRELLKGWPNAFELLAHTFHGGKWVLNVELVTPHTCKYPTPEFPPTATNNTRGLVSGQTCNAAGLAQLIRGAQNAPGPTN